MLAASCAACCCPKRICTHRAAHDPLLKTVCGCGCVVPLQAGAVVQQSLSQIRTVAAYNGEEAAAREYDSQLDVPQKVCGLRACPVLSCSTCALGFLTAAHSHAGPCVQDCAGPCVQNRACRTVRAGRRDYDVAASRPACVMHDLTTPLCVCVDGSKYMHRRVSPAHALHLLARVFES